MAKLAVCQLIAMGVCLFVTLYHSPTSETLLQVNRERLLFYAASFGVFFLLAGEVSGLFVDQRRSGAWKRVFLALVSSGLAVLALIILVWTIEFDFVGRFAALKMLGGLGLTCLPLSIIQGFLSQENPWRTLVLASAERREQIRDYLGPEEAKVAWVDLDGDPKDKDSLLRDCDSNGVELLLLEEDQESEVPVMPLLASGVRGHGNCGLRGNLLPKDSSGGSGRRLANQAQPPPTRSHRPKGQAIERPFIGLPWIGPFSSHFVARQPRNPSRFGFPYIFPSNREPAILAALTLCSSCAL